MRSGKDFEQKEDKRSREVSGTLERVHSGAQLLGEKRRLRKCKSSIRRF